MVLRLESTGGQCEEMKAEETFGTKRFVGPCGDAAALEGGLSYIREPPWVREQRVGGLSGVRRRRERS